MDYILRHRGHEQPFGQPMNSSTCKPNTFIPDEEPEDFLEEFRETAIEAGEVTSKVAASVVDAAVGGAHGIYDGVSAAFEITKEGVEWVGEKTLQAGLTMMETVMDVGSATVDIAKGAHETSNSDKDGSKCTERSSDHHLHNKDLIEEVNDAAFIAAVDRAKEMGAFPSETSEHVAERIRESEDYENDPSAIADYLMKETPEHLSATAFTAAVDRAKNMGAFPFETTSHVVERIREGCSCSSDGDTQAGVNSTRIPCDLHTALNGAHDLRKCAADTYSSMMDTIQNRGPMKDTIEEINEAAFLAAVDRAKEMGAFPCETSTHVAERIRESEESDSDSNTKYIVKETPEHLSNTAFTAAVDRAKNMGAFPSETTSHVVDRLTEGS